MRIRFGVGLLVVLGLCGVAVAQESSLLKARDGHVTKLTDEVRDTEALETPPAELFSIVKYKGAAGELKAILQTAPEAQKKHPAIIWITGGFPPSGIGALAWEEPNPANEQAAQAYRRAGVVMMYPTVRGAWNNPGHMETFYGEVDDILAALDYLKTVDYVDPERIYLGGHSTGGTLALLVAEATDQFKAVIAFGPVDDPAGYGPDVLTYDPGDEKENRLRAPIHYLDSLSCPTFVIEGVGGNVESLRALEKASKNRHLHCFAIEGGGHFDVLHPINVLVAEKISRGKGELKLTEKDVQKAFDESIDAVREAADEETLALLKRDKVDFSADHTGYYYLLSRDRKTLGKASREAQGKGFREHVFEERRDEGGQVFWELVLTKKVKLKDAKSVFANSKVCDDLKRKYDLHYDGWDVEE
jgi:alpha/beta superfamily hydrolase/regulator of RNase E activity RraB